MFYGNILVSHGFRLILSIYQCFIQILTDIRLTAGYFDAVVQRRLDTVQKMIFVDFHLFDHFQNQAVVLMQEVIQQMLLLYFLVAEIVCGLFQVLYSLQRFLCEFTDIHNRLPPYLSNANIRSEQKERGCKISFLCSIRTITLVISTVKR